MIGKRVCATLVAGSLVFVSAEKSQADEAAALIGGALLGGLIVNEVNKNKQRQRQQTTRSSTSSRSSSGISSAQRQQNREVQTALNYFGYNVGAVDGSLGRKSRAGISRYQADMRYGIDGYLDDHERSFLLTSYQRALASAHVAPYNQILASQGQAGLLRTYRNEQLGIPTPQAVQPQTNQPQTHMAMTPQPLTTMNPQPSQVVTASQPQNAVTARANSNAALPNFGFVQAPKSVNTHCNEVNVLTATNGGPNLPGQIREPGFALNEQFCQARTHAMAEASKIEVTIPNMTAQQIEQQCDGLTQAMAPQIDGIETAASSDIIARGSQFLANSGQPMDSLISGGKVCLGVGYRTDDAEMTLASAALLSSAGQLGYGEIVSHQLREGFGTSQPSPRSAEWMRLALNAAQSGAKTVLGQTPDRVAVLNGALTSTTALPAFPTASGN